jgi:hypothetical protein
MSFIFYNPNPKDKFVGDCVIRAVFRLTHQDWRTTFRELCDLAYDMCDMPSAENTQMADSCLKLQDML